MSGGDGFRQPPNSRIANQIKRNCLVCKVVLGCGHSRGLCCVCYGKAREQVRRKMTTWEAIVGRGRALPVDVEEPSRDQGG